MGRLADIKMSGMTLAIEALVGVNKDAHFAQLTAMRHAGRRARRSVVRKLAAQHGVAQNTFTGGTTNQFKKTKPDQRGRVQAIPQKRREGLAVHKLWAGFKYEPRASESKRVAAKLRAQYPDGFEATMASGHTGWFVRRYPTVPYGAGARQHPNERRALPIDEAKLETSEQGARFIMLAEAESAMRREYAEKLELEFNRRRAKRRRRRR